MECWSDGVLECWSVGVLECWSVGVLECWSVGDGLLLSLIATTASLPFFLFTLPAGPLGRLEQPMKPFYCGLKTTSDLVIGHKK
jgi:hypothetical protein